MCYLGWPFAAAVKSDPHTQWLTRGKACLSLLGCVYGSSSGLRCGAQADRAASVQHAAGPWLACRHVADLHGPLHVTAGDFPWSKASPEASPAVAGTGA